ncbi:hypothetical protein [Ornithinimicrobium kibberense]|uniref:hypothetical protein n=1 Tax=Ornithinimicrobium kibberense TaxID=282060 RepID=UPI00361DD004
MISPAWPRCGRRPAPDPAAASSGPVTCGVDRVTGVADPLPPTPTRGRLRPWAPSRSSPAARTAARSPRRRCPRPSGPRSASSSARWPGWAWRPRTGWASRTSPTTRTPRAGLSCTPTWRSCR